MQQAIALLTAVLTLALGYVIARISYVRYSALRRLYDDDEPTVAHERTVPQRWLAKQLSLAGYRKPSASAVFVGLTLAGAVFGVIAGQFYRLVLVDALVEMVANVPGGAGEMLATILVAGPWILFFAFGMAPTLVIRSVRRRRVLAIEQDLPLVLELFATMGEAGLGFDAALAKVVRARDVERPLISEFINFQLDLLAGMPRTQALRQLARRADVKSLTGFASSLIQAEQVGASMADTLRHQADDLRQRRRENALLQAQALPVKLVFPLVICFLPGIFVSTLAPVLFQMIQVANSALGAAGR